MTATKQIKYRPDIDGLRGLAVLLVLGFHAFPRAVPAGFIGVDIFFVISGFLISSILYREFAQSPHGIRVIIDFYGRRVRRIFPSLILLLVACYVLGLFVLLPSELKRLALHVTASAAFCLNLFLSQETGYFDNASAAKPLLHLWSLGVEEQFYLFWPLLIWLGARSRSKLLPGIVFLAAVSFFWSEYRVASTTSLAFFLPQFRLWELALGAIVAKIYPPSQRPPRASASRAESADSFFARPMGISATLLSLVGFVLIGFGLFFINDRLDLPSHWNLLPTLGAALVICAGESAWINRCILSRRVCVGLGLISFPLYLWHWPLLVFAQIAFGQDDSALLKTSVLITSVALAWVTYQFAERPIRHTRNPGGTAVALLGVMLVVGGGGYYSYLHNGFPARFPSIIRELHSSTYDYARSWREGRYFLLANQDETDFPIDAREVAKDRPTIYLWGDSHAAQLYPGYKAFFAPKNNVVQRTAAGTPPLLGADIPNCPNGKGINQYVFESILRDRPESVVLAANWCACDWTKVAPTITALKAAGIHHIILVGPTPQWVQSLPQQLLNYSRGHRFSPLPLRMKAGLKKEPFEIDPQMAELAKRMGVEYISPLAILVNGDGVITRLGDTANSLIAFDYGHLTIAGSQYLVSHFPAE